MNYFAILSEITCYQLVTLCIRGLMEKILNVMTMEVENPQHIFQHFCDYIFSTTTVAGFLTVLVSHVKAILYALPLTPNQKLFQSR